MAETHGTPPAGTRGVSCARAGHSYDHWQDNADTRHPPRTYVDSPFRPPPHTYVDSPSHSHPRPLAAFTAILVFFLLFISSPAAVQAGEPPELTGIDAALAFSCGERSIYVEGRNIQTGATVKLTRAGQPDIVASQVAVVDMLVQGLPDMVARCLFDLSQGTAGGFWSVVLTNPDAQSATLPDALEVDPSCPRGAAGHLYVSNAFALNVLQFDAVSGALVCIFVDFSGYGARVGDLIWAPNGHLWVIGNIPSQGGSLVLEFDGNTGEFIRFIIPPGDPIPASDSLALGGPNGDLFIQARTVDGESYNTRQHERATWAFLGIALNDVPPMVGHLFGGFASNGNYLVAGQTQGGPVPTLREYDPVTFALIHEHINNSANGRFVEWWDGYYVPDRRDSPEVKRYSLATLEYLDTPIQSSPCYPGGCGAPDVCCFEMMNNPLDVAFSPNGNMLVVANKSATPCPGCTGGFYPTGAVHEFDYATGDQIRLIGRQGFRESTTGDLDPQQLIGPEAMEFKPLPGDYASSGGAFQGDWVIDENDLAHFGNAFSGAGSLQINPHYRLSFDFDRDGDIDCDDWPAFRAAFLASSGYSPDLPMLDIPDFVAALLGTSDRPCLADRNGDGIADGLDIPLFVQALLSP